MVRVIADNAYSTKCYGSSNIIKKTKISNHSFLLYVDDPPKSAEFNEKLLRAKPVEAAPGYAMFALTAPTMLGLWKCADVLPSMTSPAGSNELGFQVECKDMVEQFFGFAKMIAAVVLQKTSHMDFRYTFTVPDPDGPKLRVFAPS